MKLATSRWRSSTSWDRSLVGVSDTLNPSLVLAFWTPTVDAQAALTELADTWPEAIILGCSTAGNIIGDGVCDGELTATLVEFATADLRTAKAQLAKPEDSHQAGLELGMELAHHGSGLPTAVLVISDGLIVNGSDLVAGMVANLPGVPISGGLAGDGPDFERTQVCLGDDLLRDSVVAVGIWGDQLVVNHGSDGGWEGFGPERIITASHGSTLLELDGQPALELYRRYLGEDAEELPSSALLFPLRITSPDAEHSLVRTVLAIDTGEQSMRFAGDVPTGWGAQLMRTTIDRLVDGAQSAATGSLIPAPRDRADVLALAVSCVGRRLVLGERADEEIEACADVLGSGTTLRGFYSYGEIVPSDGFVGLHNQTMTVTVISEQTGGSRSGHLSGPLQ
ncbi:MAG: FIST C-terminal domain-containing protein [Actinobacteria bacterium]|nr:FIST C-terminal domain-containing protein [Actinomycetota bacterium]